MANVTALLNSMNGPRGWRAVYVPVLIMLACLGVLIVSPVVLLARLGIILDMRQRTSVALVGTLMSELILFGFLLRWLKSERMTFADIGWRRPTTIPALILAITFALGYAVYTLSNPLIGSRAGEISLFKAAGAVVGVIGAIVEESVFRGYLISELRKLGVSTGAQIILSGASFGIIHAGFSFIGILFAYVLGIAMATAYVIGKHSLASSVIGHTVVNILVEPWLLLFIVTMYARLGQTMIR